MPYTYSGKTIEDKNIVQSREFDNATDVYVDTFNGGIDRDNLPVNAVDIKERGEPLIAGRHWFSGNCTVNPAELNGDGAFTALAAYHPRGNFIIGYRYDSNDVSSGGNIKYWKSLSLDGVEEGMMTITYKQWSYIPKYWTYYRISGASEIVAKKYFQIYIKYNGVVVYRGEPEYQMWLTRTHCATFPCPAGDGLVEVGFSVPEQRDDSDLQVILTMLGGQISAFNRRR
jgi:hypothetical protein